MPEFRYLAQDAGGKQISGTLSAATSRDVATAIMARALTPLQIMAGSKRPSFGGCSAKLSATFYTQMADLLRTGVPLMRVLDVLKRQAKKPVIRDMLQTVRDRIADGASLSEAMQAHPQTFNAVTIGIIRAGEEGGFLEESLRRNGVLQERADELRGRVIGALVYPALLTAVGSLIILGLLVFFVPNFAPIFDRLAAQGRLPAVTQVLMSASEFLRSYGAWLILGFAAIGFLALPQINLSAWSSRCLSWAAQQKFGGLLIRELATARMCRVLGTLLKNEVPLVRSLRITADALGNAEFAADVNGAADAVADGKSLAAHLGTCPYLPGDVAEMLSVGEQANTLDTVLIDAADVLERRSSRRLDLCLKLLEPILLLLLAGVVLLFVIGLMLPIFDSSGSVS